MKYILIALLCTAFLFSSCANKEFETIKKYEQVSFKVKLKEPIEFKTRSNALENEMNGIYLIVFDRTTNMFVECRRANLVSGDSYAVALTARASGVKIVAIANVISLIEASMGSWVTGSTTYDDVVKDLLTNELSSNSGRIVAMPEIPPMSGEMLLDKIDKTMTITNPFLMERATAKITISSSAVGLNIIGANIYNAPTKGYVVPNESSADLLAITRANYAGTNGQGGYGSAYMISNATPTSPLYCYEIPTHTDIAKQPYLIINTNRGYYRVNLTDKEETQLNLQRNYYYKINISKVINDGATTPEEAENNPPLLPDIEINDPDSYEIISNGIDYLGLSNSKYILYISSVINEFNSSALNVYLSSFDYNQHSGFVATTLTYKSRSEGSVTCTECVTESDGTQPSGIRFREANVGLWNLTTWDEMQKWGTVVDKLTLPASANSAVSRMINIVIPHDFVSGKLLVKIGSLEKIIDIERNPIISHMGDTINMGRGYSTANIDFEKDYMPAKHSMPTFPVITNLKNNDLVSFSNSENGNYNKSLEINNNSDELFVKVNSLWKRDDEIFTLYQMFSSTCSEFYLTTEADQSRTKVHLIREPFNDGIKDSHIVGSPNENYSMAFWRNNEKGERIIRIPKIMEYQYWSARVIYGQDFIRLSHIDPDRTIYNGATAGDAEDYGADETWKTYLEQKHFRAFDDINNHYPMFRIALTGNNPNPSVPRYGLVTFMCPYAAGIGVGQTFLIFIRQGEEADYVFSPTEQYNGAQRQFAQAFSPFNLTVPDPDNHPGGPNYSDHKSMNGRGVFAKSPNETGYLYRYGDDIAIHPSNPDIRTPIANYDYDFDKPYQEICPPGYSLPKSDDANSAFLHSFTHPTGKYEREGQCADGYRDRLELSRIFDGRVYFNATTLSCIYFTKNIDRVESNNGGMTWATIDNWAGDSKLQGYLNGNSTGGTTSRDRLMPVRCVKTPIVKR